jgi:hypothetical protein
MMHPELAAQQPALSFKDAADYINHKAGLSRRFRVWPGQVLQWAIRNNCVSVSLPLPVRARQKDAPTRRAEKIDGVVDLVLDEIGLRVAHGVRVEGNRGASVTRDGVSYEFLDPQPEDRGSMPKTGSALPAHAFLVVSRGAIARFVAALSPAAAPAEEGPAPTLQSNAAGAEVLPQADVVSRREASPALAAVTTLPDTTDARKTAVKDLIRGCGDFTRERITRNHLAAAMRHKTTRQFYYWQANSKLCTPETAERMGEILKSGPRALVDRLRKLKQFSR